MDQREFNKLFKQELEVMAALVETKNRDYSSGDALQNLCLIETVTGGRLTRNDALLVRICDKLSRVENLTRPGVKHQVNDESVNDTLRDAANYFVIWKILREHQDDVGSGTGNFKRHRRGNFVRRRR